MSFHNGGTATGFIGYADQLVSGGASDDFALRATNDLVLQQMETVKYFV